MFLQSKKYKIEKNGFLKAETNNLSSALEYARHFDGIVKGDKFEIYHREIKIGKRKIHFDYGKLYRSNGDILKIYDIAFALSFMENNREEEIDLVINNDDVIFYYEAEKLQILIKHF